MHALSDLTPWNWREPLRHSLDETLSHIGQGFIVVRSSEIKSFPYGSRAKAGDHDFLASRSTFRQRVSRTPAVRNHSPRVTRHSDKIPAILILPGPRRLVSTL